MTTSPNPRALAVATGALLLVTHVTSVAAAALYQPFLDDPSRAWTGSTTPVLVGGFLELVLAVAVIGVAVSVYPVVRRTNEAVAIGYVGLRTLEASGILAGAVAILGLVTLAGGDQVALTPVATGLAAVHQWAFTLGQGLVVGVDTVLLAWLMWRSQLVPRWIAWLGLVGGPLVFVSDTAVMFDLYPQVSVVAFAAAVPAFAWEISLALYLLIKGFRPSALDAGPATVPGPAPATA